ncbi:MAG: hypothetical protein QXU32_13405 [Nitrososphaerales archaeon]
MVVQPDTIPNKLDDKINYKIIFLIIIAAISFQIFIYFLDNQDQQDLIISTVSVINPLAVSIAGFAITNRYRSSKTFGKAYFVLGCGYLSAAFGEILYFVFVLLEMETFPSIIDIFFFMMYPFILIHLIICIRFFKPKITSLEFAWIILTPIVITTVYITSYAGVEKIDLEFYFGIIYVVEPAIVLPLAILGAKVFRDGIIGTSWIILVLAIITLTIGDVWYSYLEIFNMYDLTHPVNTFWYAGYWVVVYALYKHKKSI